MEPNDIVPNENQEQIDQQQRLHEVADNIERKRHLKYRHGLVLRLIWLTVFIAGFMMLIFLLHDLMVRQQYQGKMTEIAGLLRHYRQENHRLPRLNEFWTLTDDARNLAIDNIQYEPHQICEKSPPDTVLAHSPLCPQWWLAERYMVVTLDFGVKWVRPEELEGLLESRQQIFNRYESTHLKQQE